MNIWDRVQLAKVWYYSGFCSKGEYISALGHLYEEVK